MIYLFDFNDSFTLNIYSELEHFFKKILVIPIEDHRDVLKQIKKNDLLILGPGPGSPLDYCSYFPDFKKLMNNGVKLWGICLGHQILGSALGLEIHRSDKPMHGQVKKIKISKQLMKDFHFTQDFLQVQSYNSLSFFKSELNIMRLRDLNFHWLSFGNDLEIFYKDDIFCCQFHPESVGTSYRRELFGKILGYLL